MPDTPSTILRPMFGVVQPTDENGFMKFDKGKPPLELLAFEVLEEVAQVLDYGAQKYSRHNWRLGTSWTRNIAAAMRHTWKWLRGENVDPETGLSHLAHAICDLMFARYYQIYSLGQDDRYFEGVTKQEGPTRAA